MIDKLPHLSALRNFKSGLLTINQGGDGNQGGCPHANLQSIFRYHPARLGERSDSVPQVGKVSDVGEEGSDEVA